MNNNFKLIDEKLNDLQVQHQTLTQGIGEELSKYLSYGIFAFHILI